MGQDAAAILARAGQESHRNQQSFTEDRNEFHISVMKEVCNTDRSLCYSDACDAAS